MDAKIQLIVDSKVNMDALNELIKTYDGNLEIRFFSEDVSGTLRNYVYGKEIAINGIKILPETHDEPSYIGTAYVNLDDIEVLDGKFKSMCDLAKPLKQTPVKKEEKSKK